MIVQVLFIVIIIFLIIYFQYMWRVYSYWKIRGVVGPKPYPFVGNYKTVMFRQESEGDFLKRLYDQYPNEKFIGIYKGIRPVLIIRDPYYIKCVLIRDYDNFRDRCLESPLRMFDRSLFIMNGGARWHAMRTSLSPSFAKSKLVRMVPYIQKGTDKYVQYVDYLISNNIEHEIRDLMSKCMTEIIGNIVFGVELEVFNSNNEFQDAINKVLNPQLQASLLHASSFICPHVVQLIVPLIKREFEKRLYNAFRKFVTSLIYQPRGNKTESPIFIDALVDLKENCKIKHGREVPDIDDDDVIQQCLTYCLATYESTSGVLSFMVHELAHNPHIQNKCYEEIMTVLEKHDGPLTLEALNEMKYLEMTLDETMRLHPTPHCIDRKCSSKYTFPDTNITVDKDTFIFIPVHGLHRDPEYFENPYVFDPERFLPENKAKMEPYVYLPFGDGPRTCLGLRLGKILLLAVMSSFLQKFKVSPCPKSKPIRYDPERQLATTAIGGVWVNIEPRS
ncbi:cytochrome P450 6B1 [Helicoverpa armigera]|uniref:cytochrome P450 6B1 n=1 Tax=Helicoverpa armigera TaxID=29058 RepID=UPI0030827ADF